MSTQNNSPATQPLEFIDSDHSFIFETDGSNKVICAHSPIEVFDSLERLDAYLDKNKDLLELDNAGIAGYISYEGDLEFGLYDNITIRHCEDSIAGRSNPATTDSRIIAPDPNQYISAIKKCQAYIKEGDIYQANLCHKFIVETSMPGIDIYHRLKASNPAPYAGYMNFSRYEIISSSPESFLKIYKDIDGDLTIASSPIKGTADLSHLNELLFSAKEKAEHIMIVDLIRNDLGRICKTGSVKVSEMLGAYKFKNLYHFISTVEGKLTSPKPIFKSIFDASFPGGSITGAPKIRAMEIIQELEDQPRGPYTGTMGYYRFKDGGEFNILIRTIVIDKLRDEISFHSGAGITAYSDPDKELKETYLKAEKLIASL